MVPTVLGDAGPGHLGRRSRKTPLLFMLGFREGWPEAACAVEAETCDFAGVCVTVSPLHSVFFTRRVPGQGRFRALRTALRVGRVPALFLGPASAPVFAPRPGRRITPPGTPCGGPCWVLLLFYPVYATATSKEAQPSGEERLGEMS